MKEHKMVLNPTLEDLRTFVDDGWEIVSVDQMSTLSLPDKLYHLERETKELPIAKGEYNFNSITAHKEGEKVVLLVFLKNKRTDKMEMVTAFFNTEDDRTDVAQKFRNLADEIERIRV